MDYVAEEIFAGKSFAGDLLLKFGFEKKKASYFYAAGKGKYC